MCNASSFYCYDHNGLNFSVKEEKQRRNIGYFIWKAFTHINVHVKVTILGFNVCYIVIEALLTIVG